MTVFKALLSWADNKELKYDKDENSIAFKVDGQAGSFFTRVVSLDPEGLLYVYSAYPVLAEPEKRERLAVKLEEKNLMLKLGALVINIESGETGYRLGQFIMTDDEDKIIGELDAVVMLALNAADQYYKEIVALIVDGESKAE